MSALRIAHPGRPVELIADVDPELALTPLQRHTLTVVRSFGGNRSRAARHLGVTVQTIQHRLRAVKRHGATVPPRARHGGRGPDLRPRRKAA